MSCIRYALNELQYRIPKPVLKEVFKSSAYAEYYSRQSAPVSIEEEVMSKVIRPRVLLDANLVGGQTVNIPLAGIPFNSPDYFTQIYHIPKATVGNKTILSVLSVGYIPYNSLNNAALS